MSRSPIRLTDESVVALAIVFDAIERGLEPVVEKVLTTEQQVEYQRARISIGRAAIEQVHAETASRRRAAQPDRALSMFADVIDQRCHDEFTVGCLACAHRQLALP